MEDADRTGRRPSRWRGAARSRFAAIDPVTRSMLGAFAAVRILGVLWTGSTPYPDSPTYRVSGTWLNFSLTSLSGDSIRPWGVTIWMALWPGDEAIVLAQCALSIVAWVCVVLEITAQIRHLLLQRLLLGAVLLLACTAPVTNWDLAVLGESVSLSTALLSLAAFLRLVRRPDSRRAAVFVALSFWFVMTRPNVSPVLLAWAVALVVIGRARRNGSPVRHRELVVCGVVAAALLGVSVYSYAYNLRADAAWTAALGYSRTTVAYGYAAGPFDPAATDVIHAMRHSGAPRCMVPDLPVDVSYSGTTAWIRNTVQTCPGMNAWATAHWNGFWATWLLTHPGPALQIVGRELPSSLSPPIWTDVTAAAPSSVADLYFGSLPLPQSAVATRSFRTQPLWIWLAAAIVLGGFAHGRRHGRAIGVALTATVAGGLAAAVSSGLLIQTVPFEMGQESLAATVLITTCAVTLVALGLDRRLEPTRPQEERHAAR